MAGPIRKRILFVSGSALAVLVALILLPGGVELRVDLVEEGETILVLPLEVGERFTLHYLHSVEDSPIWEEHSLDGEGRIYVEEERYLKVGAGMGYLPGRGRLVDKGEYEAIVDMHSPTGDFILRVGAPSVAHTIIWRGTETNLSATIPGQAVRFKGRKMRLWERLWQEVFPHPRTPGR